MKKVIDARIYENGTLALDIGDNVEGEEMMQTLAQLFVAINKYQKQSNPDFDLGLFMDQIKGWVMNICQENDQ